MSKELVLLNCPPVPPLGPPSLVIFSVAPPDRLLPPVVETLTVPPATLKVLPAEMSRFPAVHCRLDPVLIVASLWNFIPPEVRVRRAPFRTVVGPAMTSVPPLAVTATLLLVRVPVPISSVPVVVSCAEESRETLAAPRLPPMVRLLIVPTEELENVTFALPKLPNPQSELPSVLIEDVPPSTTRVPIVIEPVE